MTAEPREHGAPDAALLTPSLRRRLACFLYEGVLLFGVVMIAGYLYGSLTQQRNALAGRHGLQAFIFLALAVYFVWFWSHGGQTVAMKTWHIRLVRADGGPVSQGRALCRYVLSWLWFVPALLALWITGQHSLGAIFGSMIAGVIAYALLAYLHPQRQYWHDAVCGTRLVHSAPAR
ncbi:MAG: RDD family protein [Betaproteobacteria bacterium]|nr:MAG: RDD family protein [Betaproteobacteria bacterium]